MESSVQGAPAAVEPADARPGLALILAVLSVPGSFFAWQLPAGGYWIGLPLATAAVVLGLRARQALNPSSMATVAVAIGGLMIAQLVVWTIYEIAS